jgi:hypothetical protein
MRAGGLLVAGMSASLAVARANQARRSVHAIVTDAQRALGMTQREFGYAV